MNNTQTIAASQEKILELANQLAQEFSKTAVKEIEKVERLYMSVICLEKAVF